jgi:Xaa-Pro aminopeptidase
MQVDRLMKGWLTEYFLDLHESSNFDRSARLTEGMVVTIEPGIYVLPSASFPKHYHNIGIRIEVGCFCHLDVMPLTLHA